MSKKFVTLPALIDPHVHFRTPGAEHKEDWIHASVAAISGGITTVLDMPNTYPPAFTLQALEHKKALIDHQLAIAGVPLRYGLYLGADEKHTDQIEKFTGPIKIYMGSSTGDLFFGRDEALERVFKMAGKKGLLVAIHAEDEKLINAGKQKYAGVQEPSVHSKIRCKEAAAVAVEKAITLALRYHTPLYIAHVSTKEELDLIREGKKRGVIYAEATPHHLFLNDSAYERLGTFAQVNPPIRTPSDQEALFEALVDGTIDTVGSDHAPHTPFEKQKPYGQAPSGVPGLETLLPLLLDAVQARKLSLERVIQLTHTNPRKIFTLPENDDVVVVDLNETRKVKNSELKTKCQWSPFDGKELTGWPVYTRVRGKVFMRGKLVEKLPEQALQGASLDS